MGRGHNARKGTLVCIGSRGGISMNPEWIGKSWDERLYLIRKGLSTRQTIPEELSHAWVVLMAQACAWFHDHSYRMEPAWDYVDTATDGEVHSRIEGFQKGYDQEWNRRTVLGSWDDYYDGADMGELERYVFADLPFWLQRVVVSRWDEAHYKYLAEHGLSYDPDEGYFWDINGYHVKYMDIDKGRRPGEAQAVEAPSVTEIYEAMQEFEI